MKPSVGASTAGCFARPLTAERSRILQGRKLRDRSRSGVGCKELGPGIAQLIVTWMKPLEPIPVRDLDGTLHPKAWQREENLFEGLSSSGSFEPLDRSSTLAIFSAVRDAGNDAAHTGKADDAHLAELLSRYCREHSRACRLPLKTKWGKKKPRRTFRRILH